MVGAVEDLSPLILGRDPRDIEPLVRIMHKHGFWRIAIIGSSAIAGIEVALWDILDKSLGLPVWRLLGGRTRDRVRVYTHYTASPRGIDQVARMMHDLRAAPRSARHCAISTPSPPADRCSSRSRCSSRA